MHLKFLTGGLEINKNEPAKSYLMVGILFVNRLDRLFIGFFAHLNLKIYLWLKTCFCFFKLVVITVLSLLETDMILLLSGLKLRIQYI